MNETLYIIRRQPDSISPSLFLGSDKEKDIVVVGESPETLPYDDLVEKVFSSSHVIVI